MINWRNLRKSVFENALLFTVTALCVAIVYATLKHYWQLALAALVFGAICAARYKELQELEKASKPAAKPLKSKGNVQ